MSLLKISRSDAWWDYKLPGFLSIGYATLLLQGEHLFMYLDDLLAILVSVILGAIFVSILNDLTDLDDDIAAGKSNRLQSVKPFWRWFFLIAALVVPIIVGIKLYFPHPGALVSFYMPCILFCLYSFRPFRLKGRGIYGVLCDAGGTHLFTTWLWVFAIYHFTGREADLFWVISVGVWSLCYGVRGILWHQYFDRSHDQISGVRTFALRVPVWRAKLLERPLIILECTAFTCMLSVFHPIIFVFSVSGYLMFVWLKRSKLRHRPVVIISPESGGFQILLLDYYNFFFPLALLLYASFFEPFGWVALAVHLLLFYRIPLRILRELRASVGVVIRR